MPEEHCRRAGTDDCRYRPYWPEVRNSPAVLATTEAIIVSSSVAVFCSVRRGYMETTVA